MPALRVARPTSARHRWEPLVDRNRWRVLQRCAKCGVLKWVVQFPDRAGRTRQYALFASTGYDPWSGLHPDCTPRVGEAAGARR